MMSLFDDKEEAPIKKQLIIVSENPDSMGARKQSMTRVLRTAPTFSFMEGFCVEMSVLITSVLIILFMLRVVVVEKNYQKSDFN